MISRRDFMKSAGLATAGLLMGPELFAGKRPDIGLQLYTMRNAMGNLSAMLNKVGQIGYTSVEGGGYTPDGKMYGMEVKKLAPILRNANLTMPSAHYSLGLDEPGDAPIEGTMLHGWDRAIEDAKLLGIKYMVLGYLPEQERGDNDHYKKLAEYCNTAGEQCKKAGIQFCYHNHDFEFVPQDGKEPYDILLENVDKELVKMELDLYFATKAGKDPLKMFQQNPGRFPLWHVKDMDKTQDQGTTEVGAGVINFKKIFTQAGQAGLQHYFVEQDSISGSPFSSIEKSIHYLKSNHLDTF